MTSPRTLLKAWNIKAKKQLGQNFLADPNIAAMIIERSGIKSTDTLIEIGAGLGALTIPLAQKADRVFAVEKDPRLIELLKTELLIGKHSNVVLLEQDIMGMDMERLVDLQGRRFIVVGNLPYNISSQIIVRLITKRHLVQRAILMFQKEMADRILAKPGGRDYGRLTAMLNYCTRIKPIATVKAALFFPKPKIDSTVLEIQFTPPGQDLEFEESFLFQVIKASFGRRRKTIKNSLTGSELNLPVETIKEGLTSAGIDSTRRAETLAIHEFVCLARALNTLSG